MEKIIPHMMKPGFFIQDNSENVDPTTEESDVDCSDSEPSYFYRVEFQARGAYIEAVFQKSTSYTLIRIVFFFHFFGGGRGDGYYTKVFGLNMGKKNCLFTFLKQKQLSTIFSL